MCSTAYAVSSIVITATVEPRLKITAANESCIEFITNYDARFVVCGVGFAGR